METHQSLLFPAFKVQFNLRESICGVSFWDSCARRRVEISKGRYMAIKDIIELVSKRGNHLPSGPFLIIPSPFLSIGIHSSTF